MSKLNAHESVMRVMVNIMSSSTGSNAEEEDYAASGSFTSRRKSLISVSQPPGQYCLLSVVEAIEWSRSLRYKRNK